METIELAECISKDMNEESDTSYLILDTRSHRARVGRGRDVVGAHTDTLSLTRGPQLFLHLVLLVSREPLIERLVRAAMELQQDRGTFAVLLRGGVQAGILLCVAIGRP